MVLKIANTVVDAIIPRQYLFHFGVFVVVVAVIRSIAQGRSTTRERDLHGRVVLVTGGFTPLGVTLLQALAQRGAHVIALSPLPLADPAVSVVIDLIRSTTSNEQVFAEECDLTSPNSVRDFCRKFLTGTDQRLDALVFAHEYTTVGSPFSKREEELVQSRQVASLATFFIVTLLLPALFVAPAERDIRIVNVLNPFYAAAVPSLYSGMTDAVVPHRPVSLLIAEGTRSLRTTMFTRQLQRILDALPSGAAQVPNTDEHATSVPVVSKDAQRSNIVAVSVSPGISAYDTVAPLFFFKHVSEQRSIARLILYMLLLPLIWVFTKSSAAAIQSVLHVLFLPTPFKVIPSQRAQPTATHEVLKPGALYRECSVVNLTIPKPPDRESRSDDKAKEGINDLQDDDEYGGCYGGQLVWEFFEVGLKAWERANPSPAGEGTVDDLKRQGQ